jgi:hypothetical protein
MILDYSIWLIHILFVGPAMILLGLYHEKVPKKVWDFLILTGIVVILYHSYLAYNRYRLLNSK